MSDTGSIKDKYNSESSSDHEMNRFNCWLRGVEDATARPHKVLAPNVTFQLTPIILPEPP
jgi:hypothetical protein